MMGKENLPPVINVKTVYKKLENEIYFENPKKFNFTGMPVIALKGQSIIV